MAKPANIINQVLGSGVVLTEMLWTNVQAELASNKRRENEVPTAPGVGIIMVTVCPTFPVLANCDAITV